MNFDKTLHDQDNVFLSAFFSDETERFRSPAEPEAGQTIHIRLRAPKADELSAQVLVGMHTQLSMRRMEGEGQFDLFETELICPEEPVSYCFLISYHGQQYVYLRNGMRHLETSETPDARYWFRFTPGFHTPDWSKGAVQYQIFPDRFRNGDPTNDVCTREYSYNLQHVRRIKDWDEPPAADDYRCFYGGDLAGILEKLDYLQSLGVEVLYLNPIFLSPSAHKYDTQDYEHIDPHFGVIEEDSDHSMQPWELHNGYAVRYITRTLSQKNLEASDALFAKLCEELHSRGMRIIIDGVFNHCGSFHRWLDREGIYREKPGFAPGALQSQDSPYRDYFHMIDDKPGYEAWWGFASLPKLCYEQSSQLCEEIFSVAQKWLKPPYCVDGWRLDVAADLGHSREFNHSFWREFRQRVKAVNPDALIIAEHYGEASAWLGGDQWDSVMNYDAFMEPVSWFFTGMDKHSDHRRDDLYQNGERFFEMMLENMSEFHWSSLLCAMNELSNHDHSRFLTRTNRVSGRTETQGAHAAVHGIDKAVLREAVAVQMTWPGAPTIYYGDEAGQVGWTDPDNRRTYPWGHEDHELIRLHRDLIVLRESHPVLRLGSFIPLGAGHGWIAFARFDDNDCVVTVSNTGPDHLSRNLRLQDAGIEDGTRFLQSFETTPEGFAFRDDFAGAVQDGVLHLELAPRSTVILTCNREVETYEDEK